MGNEKSKPKKGKAEKKGADEDGLKDTHADAKVSKSKDTGPNAAASSAASASTGAGNTDAKTTANTSGNGDGKAKDDDDSLDPSWNDQVLFSKGKQEKLTTDDFELLKVIGKGSFGKVMQVKKKDDGQIYAMKVLRKDAIIARKQVTHTKAEKSILQKIQHPFIVRLHYAFQTNDKLYMILDFVNGGELFYHLKKEGKFAEPRVRFYAAQIASAMGHLHSLGVVYRDLKPENILLDSSGNICITDFGLSKEIKPDEGTQTFCGTPEYLAPEILRGEKHGIAVDWWSLGTLVYEMLTGLPPFYSNNINIMYKKILEGELKFPSYISPDAQSFIAGLLTRDFEKRLGSGTSGSDDIRRHPFFKEIDWAKLESKEMQAPFKPNVSNTTSTDEIDPEFTSQTAKDSVSEGNAAEAVNFENFTYTGESAMEVK